MCQLSFLSMWPQNIGKSMSCQEFITNLNGLQDGGNFPKELLKVLWGGGGGGAQGLPVAWSLGSFSQEDEAWLCPSVLEWTGLV